LLFVLFDDGFELLIILEVESLDRWLDVLLLNARFVEEVVVCL